jgi:NADPH:quinone reductase-like Zn-dependent oxidoreductase
VSFELYSPLKHDEWVLLAPFASAGEYSMSAIPGTMRAVQLFGQGGVDQLVYREDVPVPLPLAGEVLLRVRGASVNNTEINHRLGWYSQDSYSNNKGADRQLGAEVWEGEGLSFPRIQGADACGYIVATGEGVDPARIGERVLVEPLFRNPTRYFGADCDGSFAEFTKVPACNAHRITSNMTDVELASFPCAFSTAENMIERANVGSGDTVLITGASGGVGSAAVQLAKRRGATVIAMTVKDKVERVRALGADLIQIRDNPLIESLGSDSVSVVIDLVGGPDWPILLSLLKHHGRYAASGAIGGPIVALDLRTFYFKDLSLLGCTTYDPEVFRNLLAYIEHGDIKPVLAKTFGLRELASAQKAFLDKAHVGKIGIDVEF